MFDSHGGMKDRGSTCKFQKRFPHYEICLWTLSYSYLHEKQTSRIQSLNKSLHTVINAYILLWFYYVRFKIKANTEKLLGFYWKYNESIISQYVFLVFWYPYRASILIFLCVSMNIGSLWLYFAEFLQKYTPCVERLGFDENFLDVTSLVDSRLTAEDDNKDEIVGHLYCPNTNMSDITGNIYTSSVFCYDKHKENFDIHFCVACEA